MKAPRGAYGNVIEVCIDCLLTAEINTRSDYDDEHPNRYNQALQHGTIEAYYEGNMELHVIDFSKSPCDYCNGTLAGQRIKAMYTPKEQ